MFNLKSHGIKLGFKGSLSPLLLQALLESVAESPPGIHEMQKKHND